MNETANDGSSVDLLTSDGRNYDGDHVPAPAGHAPRVELQVSADRERWRLQEDGREEAWIEFSPTGAI
ncbi:hypothetical protein [Haloparvum sedimenti]|uniref:hypothetical protein n=1 Tax=Haloparvum sedimenti TaxID=1678448 RepID=UPI00071E77C0|nr:hypothetical protein [Haloparvum sedimenti]